MTATGWSRRSSGSWVEPLSTALTDGALLPPRFPLRPRRMQHQVPDPRSARIEGGRGDGGLAQGNRPTHHFGHLLKGNTET